MTRETFVAVLSAILAEADNALLLEAENLLQGRRRTLRQEAVQRYAPGQDIVYLARDGHTKLRGVIDHLNKFSITVLRAHPTEGTTSIVVPIERVLGLHQRPLTHEEMVR